MLRLSGHNQNIIEYMVAHNALSTTNPVPNSNSALSPTNTPSPTASLTMAEECISLILSICADYFIYPWPELRRCICECLGILCRLTPEVYTEKVLGILREKV